MNFLSAPRGDLIRLIYDLIDEKNALKAQLAEIRARLGEKKSPSEEKLTPSFVKPNVKRKKVVGSRRKRELNFTRTKDTPTNQIFHSYDKCPDCGGFLGKPSVSYKRQIIDIPVSAADTVEHVIFKRWCTNCGKRVSPKVNFSGLTVGKKRFGINITSLVSALSEEFHQPLNKIQNFLKMMFGVMTSEGELVHMLDTTKIKGEKEYESIKTHLRKSDVVYGDETGSRENGRNGYLWSFSNDKYQILLYGRRRNMDVVKEFVGKDQDEEKFEGVMVSDFLGSYNEYSGFHQRCWVHMLRAIKELKERVGSRHPPLNKWARKVKNVYEEAKEWAGPDPTLPLGTQAQMRIDKENYFKQKLKDICEPYIEKESRMSTLSARMITHLSELFVFIRFEGVDPDNNRAERALRHSVVRRKISGGTRSAKGSGIREVLGSLFGTWRLQGLNPLEQTRLLLARAPCQ